MNAGTCTYKVRYMYKMEAAWTGVPRSSHEMSRREIASQAVVERSVTIGSAERAYARRHCSIADRVLAADNPRISPISIFDLLLAVETTIPASPTVKWDRIVFACRLQALPVQFS